MSTNNIIEQIKIVGCVVIALLCDAGLSIAVHLFCKFVLPRFGIKYNLPFVATCVITLICTKILFNY